MVLLTEFPVDVEGCGCVIAAAVVGVESDPAHRSTGRDGAVPTRIRERDARAILRVVRVPRLKLNHLLIARPAPGQRPIVDRRRTRIRDRDRASKAAALIVQIGISDSIRKYVDLDLHPVCRDSDHAHLFSDIKFRYRRPRVRDDQGRLRREFP